jgi:predicted dehydrogenase
VAPSAGYADAGRGIGVADLAGALATGRAPRASGELALHVLDLMESVIAAGREGRVIELGTTVERPAAVPFGASPAD